MRLLLFILASMIFLCGCAATEADLDKVEVGMTKEQVRRIMGKPAIMRDETWIYHYVGNIDSVHINFMSESDKKTDRVTDVDRYYRDPQMIGEPR